MSEYRHRISRRGLLGGVAGAAATASLLGSLALSIVEAAQGSRKPTLDSIEHVVILMQENRSFDHYYGTMKGVRGFGDRALL
jgi:phospholipase C